MAIELSSDLVEEEILSWVPARSLAKLRHTCKHWKTLIANPRFVKKHSSQMRCREQQFTIFNKSSTSSCVGIDFDELSNPCMNLEVFKPVSSWDNMFHCDGLLGLVTQNSLLVMNPLLKQARWIKCSDGFYHNMDAFGIGYISNQLSSSCNDYKMIRFCNAFCPQVYKFSTRIEVYEFKSDSWKVIVDKTFVGFFGLPFSSVCLKGTPYWIGYEQNYGVPSIKSFDFSKERFDPLFLPPSSFKQNDSPSLGIFRGDDLSLLHNSSATGKIELWVMKKHWSRLVTVTIPELSMFCIYSSYLIENNSKLVLSGSNLGTESVSIYIVGENQECRKLEHHSCMDRITSYCYYVPSLLQVPRF